MNYYSTVLGFLEVSEKKPTNLMKSYGSSVVDKSKFRPTLVNNGSGQRVVGSARSGLYDFEDGKDTGLRLGVIRSPAPDITEVDSVKQILEKTVNNQVSEAKVKFDTALSELEKSNTKEDSSNGNE